VLDRRTFERAGRMLVCGVALSRILTPAPSGAEGVGTVVGRVLYGGETPPPPRRVENTTDPEVCGRFHDLEDLVLGGDSRGIANVLVAVVDVAPELLPPTEVQRLTLDNRECRFEPHAAVATVGSTIVLRNSDETLHTVHLYGRSHDGRARHEENVAMPFVDLEIVRPLDEVGIYQIRCDVHGWMLAYLRVDDHSLHAVTDSQGEFRIEGVPPGRYTLEAFHERLGFQRVQVDLRAEQATEVQLTMPE
jgi:plastocyanin